MHRPGASQPGFQIRRLVAHANLPPRSGWPLGLGGFLAVRLVARGGSVFLWGFFLLGFTAGRSSPLRCGGFFPSGGRGRCFSGFFGRGDGLGCFGLFRGRAFGRLFCLRGSTLRGRVFARPLLPRRRFGGRLLFGRGGGSFSGCFPGRGRLRRNSTGRSFLLRLGAGRVVHQRVLKHSQLPGYRIRRERLQEHAWPGPAFHGELVV